MAGRGGFDGGESPLFHIRVRRQDNLLYRNQFQQHLDAVAVVVMEMGQDQQVQTAASGGLQVVGGRLAGVFQIASAAVQHQGGIPGEDADALPLPHIQRRRHRVGAEVSQAGSTEAKNQRRHGE